MGVRFHDYERRMYKTGILDILEKAQTDVSRHAENLGMGTRTQKYKEYSRDFENTALWLYPKTLTWGQWGLVVDTLKEFYELWDPVGLQFDVLDVARGDKPMAYALLGWES